MSPQRSPSSDPHDRPCSACPTDVDGNGATDVLDLVEVILAWGTGDPVADVNDDGTVDVSDMVDLILAWGPCR